MNEPRGLVLLVDDDPSILLTVGDQLTFDGYRVVKARSAEECLKLLEDTAPDLIVLDIAMPGIGGLAFLKQISTSQGNLKFPVLVFTARAEMDQFFDGTNVDGFLAKTANPSFFLKEVARIIHKHKDKGGAKPKAGPRRLLIAEDDPDLSENLQSFFRSAGFEVSCVSNGRDLIQHALAHRPDIICLNFILSGMSGPAAAAMLGTIPDTRMVPVILYDGTGIHDNRTTYANVRTVVSSSAPPHLFHAIQNLSAGA